MVEVIERNLRPDRWLVAIDTCHRLVSAGQWERRRLMFGQRVVGRLESGPSVALFTTITPWSNGELALVFVLVAINT